MATAYAPFLDAAAVPSGTSDGEATRIVQRRSQLLGQRQLYDTVNQDIVDLMMPGAPDITRFRSPGAPRTDRLFDTTAILALQTLAANMMGGLTNQAITWQSLTFRDALLKDNQAVSTWLADVDQIMMAAYAASNFYQAAHSFYLTLAAFGTAAMYVGSMEGLGHGGHAELFLTFRTLSAGQYVIAENQYGKVDTLFRDLTLTPRQARQQFGEVAISPQLREQARNPMQMDQPKRFVHAVYPRADAVAGKLGAQNMPYIERYLELDTQHVCARGGYEEFPFLVARWETVGDGPWGFGPGQMALPDVRTLNMLRELMLLQLQLWVQPPLTMLEEGVIGSISLESLAVNVITKDNALKTMDLTGRPDLVRIEEETLRKSIRDLFFADVLTGLPPVEATQMTAFEVAQRLQIMQQLMGPAMMRLLSEFLGPLADRVFGLLWRADILPPVPREVVHAAQRNQGQLDIEHEGPMARAQRGSNVKAVAETLTMAGQMVGLTQDAAVLDNLDLDAMLRVVADANGTPRKLLRDTVQVDMIRRERQAQQQQMAQAAAQAQQAESLGAAAPMVKAFTDAGQMAAA